MRTAAVIAEYNPFHKGHEYLLRKVRNDYGADFIIVLMSGDFVQRGAPAMVDKYVRTKMALACGADLVLELPLPAAVGSARDFAYCGVSLLGRLGAVDSLWFGSESGNLPLLKRIAEILADEPKPYGTLLTAALRSGKSYPAAQSEAALGVLSASDKAEMETIKQMLSSPNELLALSYLRAMRLTGSAMQPFALERRGGAYHAREEVRFAGALPEQAGVPFSAEAIREAVSSGRIDEAKSAMPPSAAELLGNGQPFLSMDDFSDAILDRVRRLDAEELCAFAGIDRDLANRISRMAWQYSCARQLAEALKTKNLTRTRIDRALLSVLLEVRHKDAEAAAERDRVRLLGMRSEAKALLREISRRGSVSVTASAIALPKVDVFAANVYEAAKAARSGGQFHHELSRKLIKS
jgi:predicted nucleotidyltransferase